MVLPANVTPAHLLAVEDPVARAHVLAKAAHAGQPDKAGNDYYTAPLLDVLRRAVAYGADADEQAAALLHDIVEDRGVDQHDLWQAGFSDRTLLMVDLMTKRDGEPVEVYYARLRAFEPARRLKLDGDMASNADPDRMALLEPSKGLRVTEKYAHARAALAAR
jgi:(p)ppGpp synthase/HD superfamily hydrolase